MSFCTIFLVFILDCLLSVYNRREQAILRKKLLSCTKVMSSKCIYICKDKVYLYFWILGLETKCSNKETVNIDFFCNAFVI